MQNKAKKKHTFPMNSYDFPNNRRRSNVQSASLVCQLLAVACQISPCYAQLSAFVFPTVLILKWDANPRGVATQNGKKNAKRNSALFCHLLGYFYGKYV